MSLQTLLRYLERNNILYVASKTTKFITVDTKHGTYDFNSSNGKLIYVG